MLLIVKKINVLIIPDGSKTRISPLPTLMLHIVWNSVKSKSSSTTEFFELLELSTGDQKPRLEGFLWISDFPCSFPMINKNY